MSLAVASALLMMVFTISAMLLDIMIMRGACKDEPHPDSRAEKLSDEEFAMFMDKVDSGMSVPDAIDDLWGEN
jgi:hypothetical protein